MTMLALSEVISGAVHTRDESLMCSVDRQSTTSFCLMTSFASGGAYSERGSASLFGGVGLSASGQVSSAEHRVCYAWY